VSLNQIITDMKAMLGSLLGEDIELVVTLDPELGYVKVDPVQMQQGILNLAANAREALPKGGRISFTTHDCRIADENRTAVQGDVIPPGSCVKVTVEDNGTGMDPDTLTHAFEPFFTTKDERVGIGLGLATVHSIVMQSSGFINVASEVDDGTRFEIFLPVAHGVPPGNIKQSDPVRIRSRNLSILVVEDEEEGDPHVRVYGRHHCEIRHARTGNDLSSETLRYPDVVKKN
jgi:two-component system cell cycle sensor histidine kinase/response regulator CckA